MVRLLVGLGLLCACGDDGGGNTTGLSAGTGSATSMAMSAGSSMSGDVTSTSPDTTSTSTPDTTSTSDAPTSSDASTSTTTGSSGEPSTSGDPSTSTTGDASPLGECISVDMWESCDQYCEADSQSCQEAACDGGTVHYYGTGGECGDLRNAQISDQACDAPLESSGGVSFARCCCG